jgi:hypothetical protein
MSENSKANSEDPISPLVEMVAQRGLVAPAIFLLEFSKPLLGCMRELCLCVGDSLLRMAVGERLVPSIREVVSSSDNVEVLIRRLEDLRDNRNVDLLSRRA